MGEFFRGWRRKVGLVTLGMAMVLMGAWLQSYSHSFSLKAESANGIVTIDNVNIPEGVAISGPSNFFCCRVPYWLIVLPLTLLSAWLILAKPRKANDG